MRNFLLAAILLRAIAVGSQPLLSDVAQQELDRLVASSATFANSHTGFCLYDIAQDAYLYGYQADHYFVPASNVKLFTLYLAQRELGYRTAGIYYQVYPDRIELWGAAYPLTLHPDFLGFDELTPWLVSRRLPLVVNLPREDEIPRYGAGWSWDDYNYPYVYERSILPVYGNRLSFHLNPADTLGTQPQLIGSPPAIATKLTQAADQDRLIYRVEDSNLFAVGPRFFEARNFPLERPLRMDAPLIARSMAEALPTTSISLSNKARPPLNRLNRHDVSVPDTIYRKLLRQSDNFLAEQLLLQSAVRRYGWADEETTLDYLTDTLLVPLGLGQLRVADGSGLSRYSLVTPRQFTRLVTALDREMGRDRLLSLLPAGGESGTLRRRFAGRGTPYVWAKTGSLGGVICVSGLVRSAAGRWFAFSFLHNNVVGRSGDYYREMERVLDWVYARL